MITFAAYAKPAFDTYVRAMFFADGVEKMHPDDQQAALGDLLCDLHHLADELDLNWVQALADNEFHYDYERINRAERGRAE